MKKFKLLAASLLTIPLITSCGGNKPDQLEFMLSSDRTIEVDGENATVYIDWIPTDHKIKFDSFTFTADPVKANTVTFDQTGDSRPMPVTITFTDGDIAEDINGTLSFTYEDATAKTSGSSSVDVTISGPRSMLPIKCSEYNVDTETSDATLWETIDYEYYDNGLVKKETYDWPDDDDIKIVEYKYDDKNNLTEEQDYAVWSGEETTSITKYDYEYDEKDRIIKCITTYNDSSKDREEYTYGSDYNDWDTYEQYSDVTSSNEDLEQSLKHEFNQAGQVIKEINMLTNYHSEYTWDDYDCNTLIEIYDDKELYKTIAFQYYKNMPDKLAERVDTDYEGGTLVSHETAKYTYDSYDRLIIMEMFDNEDKVFSRDVYEYAN